MVACVVLVVSIKVLCLDIVLERVHDGLLAFDVELDVVESLCPTGLVVDVLASDIRKCLAFKKLRDDPSYTRPLHLDLVSQREKIKIPQFVFAVKYISLPKW